MTKKLKLLYRSAFISLMLVVVAVKAQESTLRMAKVHETEVLLGASKERPIPDLIFEQHTEVHGIVRTSSGETTQLFLENLATGQRTLIDEFATMSKNPAIRLTGGGRYISYNIYNPDRSISAKICDTQTGQIVHIVRSDGNVAYPDINPRDGRILYQMNNPGEMAKVYLTDKSGNNHQFIVEGRGARWSPDGNWFYLLHDLDKETIREITAALIKARSGRLSRERSEKKETFQKSRTKPVQRPPRRIEFFNSQGESQVEIAQFIEPAHLSWSPQSNKIVVRDWRRGRIYLISFLVLNHSLQLKLVEDILSDTPEKEYFIHPVWSPEGSRLTFEKVKDSHYGFENIDVVLFDLKTRNLTNLTNTKDTLERVKSWNLGGSLFIESETKSGEPLALQKITLEQ